MTAEKNKDPAAMQMVMNMIMLNPLTISQEGDTTDQVGHCQQGHRRREQKQNEDHGCAELA